MSCDLNQGSPFRVWRVDTAGAPEPYELETLDAAEQERGRRFVRQRDRNAFLKTRAALRQLLGRALGAMPQEICFEKNAWGKPCLAGQSTGEISFSVSHTDELSVIVVSDGRKIGIDVERDRIIPDRDRIAANIFGGSAVQALSNLADGDRNAAFLRLWTAAEAFVKANGTGFAGREERIPVSLSDSSGGVRLDGRTVSQQERSLSLFQLSLPHGYIGSMVIEGSIGGDGAIVPALLEISA